MIKINDNDFERLINYIRDNYGINLSQKRNLIEGRLTNAITEKGFSSFTSYLEVVFNDKSKSEIVFLIDKLTTNHTFFMREASHFEFLKDKVLPHLKETKKDRDLRIWSAGCSSGEEPYTIAMIINDFFKGDVNLWERSVLATDISTNVLEKAKRGIFYKEEVNKLPDLYRTKYFTKLNEEQYKLVPDISNHVIFGIFNLMTPQFPFKKKFDVIFCRNVMIYFEKDVKMALINKFYENLAVGGYLFIGQAESIPRNETQFKYIMPAVYLKE